MCDIFYDIDDCDQPIQEGKHKNNTLYGIQSVKFLGLKIWAMVPQNIKNCKSLQGFNKLIKVWKPKACPCRMCKKYVADIGFI